jgi:hypothetical protein
MKSTDEISFVRSLGAARGCEDHLVDRLEFAWGPILEAAEISSPPFVSTCLENAL